MDGSLLRELFAASKPEEKAASVAEALFDLLPEQVATAARRCIIFHWFDEMVVASVVKDFCSDESQLKSIYEQIKSLPFVESLQWGLAFNSLTRAGLLSRYALSQPMLLKTSASLAVPAYYARKEDGSIAAEAFFCYLIADEYQAALELFRELRQTAVSNGDWDYIDSLLELKNEIQQFGVGKSPLLEIYEQDHWLAEGGTIDAGLPQLPTPSQVVTNPNDGPESWMEAGISHMENGRYDKAVAAFDQALQFNSSHTGAYIGKGIALARLNRYEEALDAFDRVLQLNPANAPVYTYKGNVLKGLGRYQEALAAYDRALKLDPTNVLAWNNMGNAFSSLGLHEEALAACDRALALEPSDASLWHSKGLTLVDLGRFEEALAAYNRSLALDPNDAGFWYSKGDVLIRLQRFEEALAAYNHALALNPNNVDVLFNKGVALEVLRRVEEALIAYDRALTLNPNDPAIWHAHARIYRFQGRLREAEEAVQRARELGG